LSNFQQGKTENPRIASTGLDPATRNLLMRMREQRLSTIEPVFQQGKGFSYPELEGHDLHDQLTTLRKLEKDGFLTSELLESVMQCPSCLAAHFSVQLCCMVCNFATVTRGAVIEHLACGNIDLDTKYVQQEGNILVCGKCGKRLKAIGVDYAKPGIFYKCLHCKALQPQVQELFTCYICGKSWNEGQLKELHLMKYSVDLEKLSKYFIEYDLLPHVAEQLYKKHGLKAESPGKVKGLSKIEHTFDLLVSHYESGEPMLVADLLVDGLDGNTTQGSIRILAFYARCLDANFATSRIIKKVLVTQSELSDDAKELAAAYGVRSVQMPDAESLVSLIREMLGSGGSLQR
jgi:hypothetical protein